MVSICETKVDDYIEEKVDNNLETKVDDYRGESKEFTTPDESKHNNSSKMNASMMRKAKVEKLKRDHSATSIQASWRGKFARPMKVRLEKKEHPSESNTTEAQHGNIGTDVDYSTSNNVSSISNKIPSEQSYDGKQSDKDDENEEENLAIARAEGEEEIELQKVTSNHKLLTWPDSLVDDFDDPNWPDLGPTSSSSGKEDVQTDLNRTETILIRVVTWNLCAKKPPSVEKARIKLFPLNMFHVYVIGTEECERSIAQSAVNTSKKSWEGYLTEVLGPMYAPIRSHTLQAIHIIAFAHIGIAHLCSDIASAAVATGMGNTLGNKVTNA
jgi:hypothetical protein